MYEWLPTLTFEQGLRLLVGVLALALASTAVVRVDEGERVSVVSGGSPRKVIGPGLGFVVPLVDDLYTIDLTLERSLGVEVAATTRDRATATATVVLEWTVADAEDAVFEVADFEAATRETTASVARERLRERRGTTARTDAGRLAERIHEDVDERAEAWGVDVERVIVEELRVSGGEDLPASSVVR